MGELMGRVWRIVVGSRSYSDIDLRAAARWPRDGAPATVDLTVYHPEPAMVNAIRAGEPAIVLAGYANDVGSVAIGGGRPVRKSLDYDRSSVDMPLTVQLSAAMTTSEVVLAASWPDTTAREVLASAARTAGLVLDDQSAADVRYPRGYVLAGGLTTALVELARDLGCRWMIDGATLRLWPVDGVARRSASVWTASTGLMSVTPAGADADLRATARLTPALRPGHTLRVEGGDVRVLEVTHEIDTVSDTWQTSIAGRPE